MKELGSKIRESRKAIGWSLKKLAAEIKISPMTLHRIETGQTSPSVVLLSEIAYQLRKPINSFIKDKREPLIVIRSKNQSETQSARLKLRVLTPRGLINDKTTISLGVAKKGQFVDEHTNQGHEWVFILKGRCTMKYQGQVIELREGDSVYFDSRYPHCPTALERLEFLTIYFQGE